MIVSGGQSPIRVFLKARSILQPLLPLLAHMTTTTTTEICSSRGKDAFYFQKDGALCLAVYSGRDFLGLSHWRL